MAIFPEELRYTETHEWVRTEAEGILVVGISDHAQESLGDVVYVELPEMDTEVEAGAEVAVVESVKAASDIYAPVAGKVVAVNSRLEDAPETVNNAPYNDGWIFKLQAIQAGDFDGLLSAAEYQAFCEATTQ